MTIATVEDVVRALGILCPVKGGGSTIITWMDESGLYSAFGSLPGDGSLALSLLQHEAASCSVKTEIGHLALPVSTPGFDGYLFGTTEQDSPEEISRHYHLPPGRRRGMRFG